jgi:hypothetical protein
MKKKQNNFARASALQITLALALISVSAMLLASGLSQPAGGGPSPENLQPDRPMPDVVRLVGAVIQNQDLRSLPYVAPNAEIEEKRLTRYPHPEIPSSTNQSDFPRFETLVNQVITPAATMPAPVLTFDGMNSSQSGCMCLPPDTDGDVGPNHYVQSVNSSIKIFDKNGNPLNGANGTTYNSFFLTLVGTPCSGFNNGDGFVFYDHLADRWVVSDFAFPGTLPGEDRSTNVSVYPRPVTLSAEVGSSMRSSTIRPTPPGSVITRNWRCGTAAATLPKTPITSRSTCLMALLLASKACESLLSTAPQCSPAAPLTPLLLTSPLPALEIPTVWFQPVFAPAALRLRAGMSFSSRSTARRPAA